MATFPPKDNNCTLGTELLNKRNGEYSKSFQYIHNIFPKAAPAIWVTFCRKAWGLPEAQQELQ
jgi:hypothetical protein